MKINKIKIILIVSIILNILLLGVIISNHENHHSIVGYYESNNINYNFSKDYELRISDHTYYVDTIYKKIGDDFYTFEYNDIFYLVFLKDGDFYIYNSDLNTIELLDKISSQNIINNSLKEKQI